jgi:hypothetical protein
LHVHLGATTMVVAPLCRSILARLGNGGLSELGTDNRTYVVPAPLGPGVVTREVRRWQMEAGQGTGRAGRPPLIGNRVPLIA